MDIDLTLLIAALDVRGDESHAAGRYNLEAAFVQCQLILLDAAREDGIELDQQRLASQFGVHHG